MKTMLRTGLIGHPLGHSYSPEIHALLGEYRYDLFPLGEDEVGPFLASGRFDALNVTIPYKKTVIPFLDEISGEAKRIGSVNTIVRGEDGKLRGYNTDYYGFSFMLRRRGIGLTGKKVLILGSGGASVTVRTVAEDAGAREITVVSRTGEDNYSNLDRHADAEILVNTTPVGMYPDNGTSPVSLDLFSGLEAVADLIYNPARTALILDAEDRGIPAVSGLSMLVAQAARASELFTGIPVSAQRTEEVLRAVEKNRKNLILTGMPGCGKSTLGKMLARELNREFVDLDERIEETRGRTIPDIFREEGEPVFRELETAALREVSKRSSLVIATGGGTVIREENRRLFRENSAVLFLRRSLSELAQDGRPLSRLHSAEELWNTRREYYESSADGAIDVSRDPETTLRRALAWWNETK